MTSLSKNILYNLFGQGFLILMGFVAVRFVFSRLGGDALGLIYFTLTFNAVLCAVMEMGVTSTTVREVATHHEDDPQYIRGLVQTASSLYWAATLLLAVALYAAAPWLVENWVRLGTMEPSEAARVLRILGIAALSALPHSLYASLFRGLQRMEFNNLIDVSIAVLQQIGTIVILASGGGLFEVAYWLSGCFILAIALDLGFSARFFTWEALIPGFSMEAVRRNRRYAFHMTSISILAMIHTQADKIIVSKWMPLGTFGYYGFAWGVVSKMSMVSGAIAHAAMPSFSARFRKGDRTALMDEYQRLHEFLSLATVPLFAVIPYAALPLFTLVFNEEVARLLWLPVALLCLGYYLNGTLNIPYVFSLAAGRPEISAKSNLFALGVVLPATVLLVAQYGLIGAGLSWVVYHLFAYAYAIPQICRDCLEIRPWDWYGPILKILVLAALTYGTGWAWLSWAGVFTIPFLGGTFASASVLFGLGAYGLMGENLRAVLSSIPGWFKRESTESTF